ncbi:DUF4974 domain-containing protein [Lampropedia puyangensis]|uniref:DUF4974 domain-containing protein n=1 Tax=Lampropedia puyangensis TaxID=1330072 RepID=A0A4S8FBQ6_9BURK|nr:FecR domain-containing protein [Lampropedia puyangensis]THU05083.1 DUF4974 domain-containing protein [Lampropedia puyangensis]
MRTQHPDPAAHQPAEHGQSANEPIQSNSAPPTESASALNSAQVETVLATHQAQLQELFPIPAARRKSPSARSIGASSALVALLVAGVWWLNPTYRTEQWSTTVGQVMHVPLADGSQLTLDTASSMRMQWRLRSRQATLEKGRAHIEAAHATWRPLTVTSGTVQVRVVGTQFDVWRQTAQTVVNVQEGIVDVSNANATQQGMPAIRLTAGQTVSIAVDLPAYVWPTLQPQIQHNQSNASAWQHSQLVFDNTPLQQAIAEIQRYHASPIRLLNAPLTGQASSLRVSGVFNSSNTDELLTQLGQILPLQVLRQPDGSVDIHTAPTQHPRP